MARSRFRSVRHDLDAALDVARIVERAGGVAAPDIVAAALGYSGTNNGAFLARLASARLFGLVGGRGRVELTERGRRALSSRPGPVADARREAVLAVPLFRAVLEHQVATSDPWPLDAGVAELLTRRFGEPPERAGATAARLSSSLAQAGLLTGEQGNILLNPFLTVFTPVDDPSPRAAGGVGWDPSPDQVRATPLVPNDRGNTVADSMWLDEPEGAGGDGGELHRRRASMRRAGVFAAAAVLVAAVAVPVALVVAGPTGTKNHRAHAVTKAGAEHAVLRALSATTDSGSFDLSYDLSETAPTAAASTTTTTQCHDVGVIREPTTIAGPGPVSNGSSVTGAAQAFSVNGTAGRSSSSSAVHQVDRPSIMPSAEPANAVVHVAPALAKNSGDGTNEVCTGGPVQTYDTQVTGSGVIDTSPMAMVVSAQIGSAADPDTGLQVAVRVDSTTVYENLGDLDPSLAPPASDAGVSGTPIDGFASLTESTLGNREGAVAMMGMASPTGYLDLAQSDITSADQTGTSTVDGVPVTMYKVTENPADVENSPGVSQEESTTIADAMNVLNQAGYSGTTVDVAVDGSGYIRQATSTTSFADGGTVVLEASFSNFGCAGTVLMPGQTGATSPPSGCTTPDNGTSPAPPTTTTTSGGSNPGTVTPSVTPSVSPTTETVPPGPATNATTVPSSTTTTLPVVSVPPNEPAPPATGIAPAS